MTNIETIQNYSSQKAKDGWLMVGILLFTVFLSLFFIYQKYYLVLLGSVFVVLFIALGFYQLQPNITGVATFFGSSRGNFFGKGLLWTNPFFKIYKVSTKSSFTKTELSKINDLAGNPINAAMQGRWKVTQPAMSIFNIRTDVSIFVGDVFDQVLRQVISEFNYNEKDCNLDPKLDVDPTIGNSADEVTYLSKADESINKRLSDLAQEQLKIAGVTIESARLTDLAYAPEIANSMLLVQQADAFLRAKTRIVKGATSVAIDAIRDIEAESAEDKENQFQFSADQKTNLVSNLLLVLCSDSKVQPVISLENPK